MLKDDTKDQIPLFDLPSPERSSDAPKVGFAGPAEMAQEKPAPGKRTAAKKPASRPEARETKSRAATRAAARPGRNAKTAPGPVPEGDVRLTANIREDLHLKLKIVAATRRTTIGELIEELVEHHL